jgi:hypothetical protein
MMVHEPMKDMIDEKANKKPRYEIRPRKSKLSIDLNRLVVEEEHELKNGNLKMSYFLQWMRVSNPSSIWVMTKHWRFLQKELWNFILNKV